MIIEPIRLLLSSKFKTVYYTKLIENKICKYRYINYNRYNMRYIIRFENKIRLIACIEKQKGFTRFKLYFATSS